MKPIHPMLVHFPIALLVLSVVVDLIAFFWGIEAIRSTGWWSLFGASLGGILTALAGLYDMRRAELTQEVHERVHRHMKVGFVLVSVISGLTAWRWQFYMLAGGTVSAVYLDCAVLAVALAAFQGWLGGELVYTYGTFVKQVTARGATLGNAPRGKKTAHHHKVE